MKTNKNITIVFGLLFIGVIFPMFSQGGWNIKYYPFKDLNSSFIGKQIFIDFKKNETDIINKTVTNHEAKYLLSDKNEDKIKLMVSGEIIWFREDWDIHVDMGAVQTQSLVSNENKIIKDIFLLKILENKIILKANLIYLKNSSPIEFEVDKKEIKGFLAIKNKN